MRRASAPLRFLAAALLLATIAVAASAQTADQTYTLRMEAGVDALVAQRYLDAANAFQLALAVKADSGQAAMLAGEALVYGRQPVQAIPLLQRAEKSEPDSVLLHELLAAAWAAMDRPKERDAERALLRSWATDGKHPTLEHVPSFLLETLWLGSIHVNATDYLTPDANAPVLYRFVVRDRAEIIEGLYCLTPWPNAEGTAVSAYALHACSPSTAQPLRVFASLPDYSLVRGTLIETLKHASLMSRVR